MKTTNQTRIGINGSFNTPIKKLVQGRKNQAYKNKSIFLLEPSPVIFVKSKTNNQLKGRSPIIFVKSKTDNQSTGRSPDIRKPWQTPTHNYTYNLFSR